MRGTENAKTKTEKFNYMLTSFVHRVRDKYYFNCPEKVHFYTSLPSYEVFNDSFRACSSTFVTTTWFYNIK